MKKILTLIGFVSLIFALVGCNVTDGGNNRDYTEPKFKGITVDGQNPNDGTGLVTFYKEKNEQTLIEIALENPDDLEIRYITINGYQYPRAKFINDYTNSLIYFYLDPGDELELSEYSVDDIIYFDGADTRNVVVTEDHNDFNIYVYKDIPVVSRENYTLTQDSISIDFDITDTDGVIESGSLVVELFSGETLVTDQVITPGFVNVVFEGLLTDKLYEIKVRADYDLDDSSGPKDEVILFNGTFTTLPTSLPSALIQNVVIGSHEITFDVMYSDEDSVTADGGLRVMLFEGDVFKEEVLLTGSTEGITFDELFNSTDYSIEVYSDYNLRDGAGLITEYLMASQNVTTLSRSVPVPQIENTMVEENRILFDVIIEDDIENPIIDISTLKAYVYVEGSLERIVQIRNEEVDIQIYDILAGKEVYIELVANYDLNDGNGVQEDQVIHVVEYESLLNAPPAVYVDEVLVTQGYITVDLLVSDVNSTLKSSLEGILYEDEVEVDRVVFNLEDEKFFFTYLVEYTSNYRVEIIADYNLRDGGGTEFDQLLYVHTLTSLVPKAPASELQNITTSNDGIAFDILVMDADQTIEDNTLKVLILKDGNVVATDNLVVGLNSKSYSNLLSDNDYEIVVVADYDVEDGTGIQTEQSLVSAVVHTKAKELPSAVLTGEESTIDSVTVDIFVTDIDDVIEPGTIIAVLKQNGVQIGSEVSLVVGDNFDITFTDIMSDTEYYIEVYVDYDLDNNAGIIPGYKLNEVSVRTDIKSEPTAQIQNIDAETETITFDVIVSDPDGVIVENTTKAILYVGDTPTAHEVVLSTGLNSGVQFTNVYSNQDFNIRIVTDYDLNDGENAFSDYLLTYDFATTGINQMVTGDIYSVSEGIDSITFSAVITDYDNVVTDNLKAILLLNNTPTGDFIDLTVGDHVDLEFTNLISDSEYTIRLVTDFDLRDISGETTDQLLDSYTTNTDDYSAPIGYINNAVSTITTITFNSIITDTDATSTGQFKVALYKDDVIVGVPVNVNVGLTEDIEFTGLLSGVTYEVRLLATYDLKDGNGDQVDAEIYSATIDTEARKKPVGNASSIAITEHNVHFVFTYVDEDLTLQPNSLKAWLYDEDGNLISSKNLYDDEVTFDISNLISDYPFEVCVTGDYNLEDGVGVVDDGKLLCLDLRTNAKVDPEIIVSSIGINQETVDAIISITDEDGVIISGLKAQLFDSAHTLVDEVVLTDGVNSVSFDATLNHQEFYNILVVGDLNYSNGDGLQSGSVLSENTIMSYNRLVPQAVIFDINETVNSFTFDVNIIDNDTTYVGNAKAVLYKDGVYVDEKPLVIGLNDDVSFDTLVSDHDYVIEIVLDYNNGDGNGDYLDQKLAESTIHVLAKQAPTASVSNEVVTSSSITVDVDITDTDNVITGNRKAVLYKDGAATGQEETLVTGNNPGISFTGLNSESVYDVKVVVDYDLDDEVTIITGGLLATDTNTTLSNAAPSAEFTAVSTDSGTITFSVTVTDDDSVITGNTKAVLYKDGIATGAEVPLSVGTNPGEQFTGLNSNSVYTINIQTDYNLLDGFGGTSGFVMVNQQATTTANDVPSAIVGNAVITVDSITFDAIVTDDDSTIENLTLKAVLYSGGLPTGDELSLVVGDNLGESFTGIYSNREYEIRIVADYDLNDGNGIEQAYAMATLDATTFAKATPNAVISNQSVTNSVIEFDVLVVDDSSAIQGSATAVLYKDGVATGQTISLTTGDNIDKQFTGLEYGVQYTYNIETDYNNNIGDPDVTGFVMTTDTQTTQALVTLENTVTDIDSVYFDILLNDEFTILDDSYMYLKLYDEADALVGSYVIEGSGTVDVLHYYNDHTYHLEVEANVTGTGQVVVYEQDLVVPARTVQAISIGAIGVNGTDISTDISVVLPDPEGVISGGTIEAVLYELQLGVWVQIDQTALIDGDNAVVFNGVDGTDGTEYMIRVEATMDFNDGAGAITDYVIDARTFIYTTQN